MLFEENSNLFFSEAGVDASDEQVGAFVYVSGVAATRAATLSAVAVAAAVLARRRDVTGGLSVGCFCNAEGVWSCLPLAAAAVGVVANAGVAIAVSARRARARTVTAARVVW